jgi:predicted nucleotidyltransferase
VAPADLQAFIDRFVAACRDDDRVLAAQLYGSRARGAADPYSDLDLGVVIADKSYEDFVAQREAFISQLGEPLFMEDFDEPETVFVIFSDGREVELILRPAAVGDRSDDAIKVLLDKRPTGARRGQGRAGLTHDTAREQVRRQIYWFWHDMSHFMAAIGRGQLWWAYGQLDDLRRYCLNLARLAGDPKAEAEGYWKVDDVVHPGRLAPLEASISVREREAMLEAAASLIAYYQRVASDLAAAHEIVYPSELEKIMTRRLRVLRREIPKARSTRARRHEGRT